MAEAILDVILGDDSMIVLALSAEMAMQMGCFLGAILIVGVMTWSAWTTVREGIRHLRRLHQIPCSRCVYFTGDYRLKCPVHPIIALTEEAIACHDYEARGVLPGNLLTRPAVRSCHKAVGYSNSSKLRT